MRISSRLVINKFATSCTYASTALIFAVMMLVLLPMIRKAYKAVAFEGTVEYRKMQMALFHRGNHDKLLKEQILAQQARSFIYDKIETFKAGLDSQANIAQAKKNYKDYLDDLRSQDISKEIYSYKREHAKHIRDSLINAFVSTDRTQILTIIDDILSSRNAQTDINNLYLDKMYNLASSYRNAIDHVDLDSKSQLLDEFREVEDILMQLLGPFPKQPEPSLIMARFGATRMDQVDILIDRLYWQDKWEKQDEDSPLVKTRIARKTQFEATAIEPIFDYIQENRAEIFLPHKTFYWQYFIDDSTSGHYFGGIGPEILGTISITLLSIIIAVPLGIISAAYLVECDNRSIAIKILRICINTLAGVPSIVFGLFGLAFFVIFLLPKLNIASKPCILSASLTLAVLALPVIISASEQAIRSVPATYREASLGLGASSFQTFIKIVFPSALPGILTGIILSVSRIAGETAPILFTGAVAMGPLAKNILNPTRTLSYGSYDMAVGDRIAAMVPHNQFGMVVTLIMIILILNAIAIVLRIRISRKLSGH